MDRICNTPEKEKRPTEAERFKSTEESLQMFD